MAVRAPTAPRPTSTSFEPGLRDTAREMRRIRRRVKHDTARPLREWAQLVPVAGVGALDFDPEGDWGYTVEPFYSDLAANAKESATRKSTQVGASEGTWRQAARRADQFGDRVMYVFPTDKHVTDFGDERIEPAIEDSPYLQSKILPRFVKNKHLKRIGAGFLYLRGANSVAAAQSVGAQMLVLDEYDELPPKMIEQYERRLSGARQIGKEPRLRRLGVPRHPGFGIDAAYEAGDQREWHVTCPECDEEQPVRWAENVRWTHPGRDDEVFRPGDDLPSDERPNPKVVGEVWRACRSCEATLEGRPIRAGRWIATNPEGTYPSWWVHRVIVPNTDLAEIVVNSRKTSTEAVEAFHQNDLGMPYAPADARLDEGTIKAACALGLAPEERTDTYTGVAPVTMGLDTAGERDFNYRISEQLPAEQPDVPNPRRALAIGTIGSNAERPDAVWQGVAELMRRYRVEVLVVDAGPERRGAKSLRAALPGRVVLCEYEWNDTGISLKVTEAGQPGTAMEGVPLTVRVHRTDAIDSMMESIRTRRNRPLQAPPPGYIDHLKAPVRRTVLDSKGRPRRVYEKAGPDDYAHAEVYDLVATELLRMKYGIAMHVQAGEARLVTGDSEGFKPVKLEGDAIDDYRAGLGE